jgi:hypothetical protein
MSVDLRKHVTSDLVVGDVEANFAIYRAWLEAQGLRLAAYRSAWVGWGNNALLDFQGQTLLRAATTEYVLESVQHGDVWLSDGRLNGRTPRGVRWEVVESRQHIPAPEGMDVDTFEALLAVALEATPVAYGVCS